MKHAFVLTLVLCSLSISLAAQTGIYQQGTIVRMRMGDCIGQQRGLRAALSGAPVAQTDELCPEYTLLTDRVVYVIVGKTSNQLIPLAESIDFRFKNNELLVRVDDARHESRFTVREMTLRSVWEHEHQFGGDQAGRPDRHRPSDAAMMLGTR